MRTLRSRVVSVLIGLLAFSTFVRAGYAAPLGTAFTYQGQLTKSGAPSCASVTQANHKAQPGC